MQFYVDIEDAAGNKLGAGPIVSAADWRVQRRMDEAGTWSFSAPLADVRLAQATPRRYAHVYALINSIWTWVGGGPIDSVATSVDADGYATATVSGGDLLRELAWRTVGNLAVSDGAGGPTTHAAAVAAVAAYAPAGWTLTADSAPGSNEIYGQFGGESVLSALGAIAERSRSHFYLSGKRTLAFASTFADAGVHAIQARGDLTPGATAITDLALDQSSYELFSRIIPVGAGQAQAALTLRATSRTAAAGYTLDAVTNYLRADATETAYGRCEQTVAFRDIGPISNTTADVIAAADALFDAAEYWLQQHAAPITSYRVAVAECPVLLRPLQSIGLVYRDIDSGIDIDADLMILAVEWTGDADGIRTASLTVADSGQWPIDDTQAVVESIASGAIYQALPQLNANAYVIAYSKNLDEVQANPAEFRFRFDEEVTQLTRIVFDFQILALESTVKSVGLETSTGGTITTSYSGSSGGSGTATTGAPSATDTGAPSNNTSGAPSTDTSGTATGSTGVPSSDT
ncbi:MAG: hypothetical protein IPM06_19835, partial [Rhizobiales bacterium]|nr:hypothetical protein [Hyphomicrobiales bacterium]